ncbi:hypothetical protein PYCC9005_004932 [Savitreella phatthalungensis]
MEPVILPVPARQAGTDQASGNETRNTENPQQQRNERRQAGERQQRARSNADAQTHAHTHARTDTRRRQGQGQGRPAPEADEPDNDDDAVDMSQWLLDSMQREVLRAGYHDPVYDVVIKPPHPFCIMNGINHWQGKPTPTVVDNLNVSQWSWEVHRAMVHHSARFLSIGPNTLSLDEFYDPADHDLAQHRGPFFDSRLKRTHSVAAVKRSVEKSLERDATVRRRGRSGTLTSSERRSKKHTIDRKLPYTTCPSPFYQAWRKMIFPAEQASRGLIDDADAFAKVYVDLVAHAGYEESLYSATRGWAALF